MKQFLEEFNWKPLKNKKIQFKNSVENRGGWKSSTENREKGKNSLKTFFTAKLNSQIENWKQMNVCTSERKIREKKFENFEF